ncbi:MAG TPA: hypothetical protein PK523_11445 [Elusimicrobiales bacterium]|nr:hypothetical protein [Elusimicrobiales bacterium]
MSAKLAMAALAMGLLSFVHLFGAEKAVMAVAFGLMALRDPAITDRGRGMSKAAIAAGLIYLAVLAGVVIYHLPGLSGLAAKLAN